MVKHILGLSGERDLIDELAAHQIVQNRINAQRFQQVPAELRADDRCCALGALGRWGKPVDAGGDGCLQGGGHTDLANIGGRFVGAAVAP